MTHSGLSKRKSYMERADDLIEKHSLQLPQLEMLLELDGYSVWFPIIGMYGGFRYWLENDSSGPALLAYNECRVVGGSEQMHKITAHGSEFVAEMGEAIKMLDEARNISGKKI